MSGWARLVRVFGGVGAAIALVGSAVAARRGHVGECEAEVFRRFNDPAVRCDRLEGPVWAVMQAGSLGGVFVVGAAVGARSGSRPAARVIAVGSAVWLLMKVVKPAIGRGRPDSLLDDVIVRGRPQTGLGYPSGHAAVSTALALTAPASPLARLAAVSVAAMAGTSRMYVGAHLPLDVVGGYSAGVLAGSVARRLVRSSR